MMTRMKSHSLILIALSIALTQTACLKTRAQLREDGDGGAYSPPVAAGKIQDVQPQGQYVIDELKSEFTRLEGRVEDLERSHKASESGAASAKSEEVKKLETRIVELETAQASMLEALKKIESSPAAASDPSELLQKGRDQFGAGNFEGALESLNAYLKTAKPKKSEEATFLRGEAYYALKDYKKAIVDFSKFPEKFPHSSRMPQALFKIGKSFDALGMKDDAKGFYQELTEKYPKSPEAKKVKSKTK